MCRVKVLFVLLAALMVGSAFAPSARADEWNQATKLVFSEPIEVLGRVLPAGTYWFILASSNADRNVVEIYSEDWRHSFGTYLTTPSVRSSMTDRTELRMAERHHNQPEALEAWFYPGNLTGHEFVYPAKTETLLAHDRQQDILASPVAKLTLTSASSPHSGN